MNQLTVEERNSFRNYAEESMMDSGGNQCQWADYTLRLLDENKVMSRLLLEARDALPAISGVAAHLHDVLSLANRIEAILSPWAVPGEPSREDWSS